MDIGTILGLVVGVLVVLKMAGETSGLYQDASLLLVVVGGIAAMLIAFPLRASLNVLAIIKNVFFKKAVSPSLLIERMVGFAETARREGILALEAALNKEDDPFLSGGVRLAVDGTEPDLIMDILETELRFIEERHRDSQNLLEFLGRYWAIFGAIGALLVLVSSGADIEVVGQAALPLLYGALLYGLVGGPFARKLQAYSQDEILAKRLIIEGIMAIQSGDNPRVVEHKLAVFLAPKYRPSPKPAAPSSPPPAGDHTRENLEYFISEKQEVVLRLVREAVQAHVAEDKQKAKVEEIADKVERGEFSIVALLALLSSGVRNKIMQQIKNPPPPLVEQAPSQGFDFEGLAGLTDKEIQMLLRQIDQKDLVWALKGASDALMEKVLANISERVRTFIKEEMGCARPQPEDILDAQARIVAQVFKLWGRDQIRLV